MSSQSPKEQPLATAFLSLPGLCTGDIWHTACAHLLWANEPQNPKVRFVALLSIPDNVDRNILETGTGRVPAMYDYLHNLGLPCVVARLAASARMDDGDCENAVTKLGAEKLDQLLEAQSANEAAPFLSVWDSLDPIDWTSASVAEGVTPSLYILPPVHHYAATTIVASYFKPNLSHEVLESRRRFLRIALQGNTLSDGVIWKDAARKVDELRVLISKARSSAGPAFTQARAVQFVYRLVDRRQPDMNPQQDASSDLFTQVRDDALAHGLVTIRIPHGMPASLMTDDDLDLFDERHDKEDEGSLKDKRYTPTFWSQVYGLPEVFGVVGSRTGALDIAAFVGLNCFEWDEPLLHEIRGAKPGQGWENLRLGRQHLEKQIPQHLRLLAQSPLMAIGNLEPESYDPKTKRYARVDSIALDSWFRGMKGGSIYPKMPQDSVTKQTVQAFYSRYLDFEQLMSRTS